MSRRRHERCYAVSSLAAAAVCKKHPAFVICNFEWRGTAYGAAPFHVLPTLADCGGVGASPHGRLACFEHGPGRLQLFCRTIRDAGRNTYAYEENRSSQRYDHDLEVGITVGTDERMGHWVLPRWPKNAQHLDSFHQDSQLARPDPDIFQSGPWPSWKNGPLGTTDLPFKGRTIWLLVVP